MIFVIVLTLLLLGIAFFQSLHGLFSAMILFLLTVLSAAIAFNYYEPLGSLVIDRMGAFAYPTALAVLFIVPLIALRELFDWKLKGNVVLGEWPDRIGGGVFGFLAGMVMVGMISIVAQMLPFPATDTTPMEGQKDAGLSRWSADVLGYKAYKADLSEDTALTPRFSADFTLGLMRTLSANSLCSMSDEAVSFGQAHKDPLLESFGLRNRPPGGSADTGLKSCQFLELYSLTEQEGSEKFKGADEATRQRLIEDTSTYPLGDHSRPSKLYVARVSVNEDAGDGDSWFRLPATHFRLVTKTGNNEYNEYYPVGYLTYVGAWRVNPPANSDKAGKIGDIVVTRPKKGNHLVADWVYRLPDNEKPEYMVFRNALSVPAPAVVAGLPVPADAKSGQLALGMKPVQGSITFPPSPGKYLQPETMETSNRLERNVPEFASAEGRPEEIKEMRLEGLRVRAITMEGLQQQVMEKGNVVKARALTILSNPTGAVVLQVRFKVNPGAAGSEEFKAQVDKLQPTVILSDGRTVGAMGTLVQSDGPGNDHQIYISFDADQAPKPGQPSPVIDPNAIAALTNPSAKNLRCIFFFAVPANADTSVTTVTLGPDYKFYPEAPLADQ